MPIYDNDGTANHEVKYLYDNDGTANRQIGKLFDNRGGVDTPIYSAEQIILPSPTVLAATTVNGGLGDGDLDSITTSALVIGAWIGFSHNTNSHYKIRYINVPVEKGNITYSVNLMQGSRDFGLQVGLYSSNGVWTPLSYHGYGSFGTFTKDITPYSGTQYIGMRLNSTGNPFANNEAHKFSLSNIKVT